MLEQTLYDKVISVTLYRKTEATPAAYKTIAPRTYSEKTVNGRKVITTGAFQDKTQTGIIEFYQGNYRDLFVGVIMVKGQYVEKYKRIYARGNSYTFNTLDEMKKGVRPDGSAFQAGDKIRVKEDGSRWNVYVEGSLTGAYTEQEILVPTQVLKIECTDLGMKPDMTLSINLLPGQNCYGAVLKIRNFNLDSVDIRSWDRMVITAGYRTGDKKAVYDCPIFSSYMESPNPDGVTVFEGLTVGVAEDVLTDKYLIIDFKQEVMELRHFIRDMAAGIASDIDVEISLGQELAEAKVNITKQKVFAQNGMAVLNWLQEFVSQAVYSMTGGKTTVFMQLVNGKLSVIAINGPNIPPQVYENIVNLDMVTSAAFTGTALNVIAPWNPSLKPGDLFYMPPQFINGAKLPNNIPLSDYRNDHNLYRAITMNVEFASTDSTNKMTVLAVPAQWADRIDNNATTEMTADTYGELLTQMYNKSTEVIPVGAISTTELKALTSAQKKTESNVLFSEHERFLVQWPSWESFTIPSGDPTKNCVSKIAAYYLYEMAGGPKLTAGMGNARQQWYQEPRSYLEDQNRPLALSHYHSKGLESQHLWWPLIMVGTYWKKRMDDKAGVRNNWDTVNPDNPDRIRAGYSLYIPVFPNGTWESNRSRFAEFRDIWKDAYLGCGQLCYEKYGMNSNAWRTMYYYLGGMEELPDLKPKGTR